MKPIPQISSKPPQSHSDERASRNRSGFPSTDYNFQPTGDAAASASKANGAEFIKLDTFRMISRQFLSTETHRDYFAELTFFAVLTAVSAWPIVLMIIALGRMIE